MYVLRKQGRQILEVWRFLRSELLPSHCNGSQPALDNFPTVAESKEDIPRGKHQEFNTSEAIVPSTIELCSPERLTLEFFELEKKAKQKGKKWKNKKQNLKTEKIKKQKKEKKKRKVKKEKQKQKKWVEKKTKATKKKAKKKGNKNKNKGKIGKAMEKFWGF